MTSGRVPGTLVLDNCIDTAALFPWASAATERRTRFGCIKYTYRPTTVPDPATSCGAPVPLFALALVPQSMCGGGEPIRISRREGIRMRAARALSLTGVPCCMQEGLVA